MYNEELKQRFIRSNTTSLHREKFANAIFGYTEPLETSLGRDVCTFSAHELQAVVDKNFGARTSTKIVQWSTLREYIRWCISSGVSGAVDNTSDVNLLGIDKAKSRMVASPMHLQRVLDAVFDQESEQTVDNATRLFCWFAYMGIPADEVALIKKQDVNLEDNSVKTRAGVVKLPPEAKKSLENCTKLYVFKYNHPLYEEKMRTRYISEQLLRGIKAEARFEQLRYTLSIHMKKAHKDGKTSTWLSFDSIALSGLFYRVFDQERAGIEPNFKAIAIAMLNENGFGTPEKPLSDKVVSDKSRYVRMDYQIWKIAFQYN